MLTQVFIPIFLALFLPSYDDADALIKQLDSSSFAQREAAQKQLIGMGMKAKQAVEKGKQNPNPEIAKRCSRIFDEILRNHTEELFLPRFIQLFGDDSHTRGLFSVIVSVPSNVQRLEEIEKDPKNAKLMYLATGSELTRRCEVGGQTWDLTRITDADVLGLLYLGTYPGTEDTPGYQHRPYLLTDVNQWQYSTAGLAKALQSDSLKTAARRLLLKWTSKRTNPSEIKVGFTCAMAYGFREVVPIAERRLDKLKGLKSPIVEDYLLDLAVIGKLGTQNDIKFLSQFFNDKRVATSHFVLLPNEEIDPNTRFRVGKDCATQIRDMAYAMALMLAGKTRQDLDDAGFFVSKFYPRPPSEADKPLPLLGQRRRSDDPFNCQDIGFIQDEQRQNAIKKARQWLETYLEDNGKK